MFEAWGLVGNRAQDVFFERFAFADVFLHKFFCEFWCHFFVPNAVGIDHDNRAAPAKVITMRFGDVDVFVQALFLEFMFEGFQNLLRTVFFAR